LSNEIIELPGAGDEGSTRGAAGGAAEGAVGMLVICHDDFLAAVTPLIDWKEKSGIKVEVVLISAIGTSPTDTDVKAAIQQRYDNWSEPSLDYLLLVGDTDFTPIHTGNGGGNSQVTDNWYACLDGSDYLPEVAVARISTRTAQETTDAVNKLLTYERATFSTTGWIKRAGFIGTEDSGHITLIEGTHDDCIDTYYTPNGYEQTAWSHGGASCDRHYNSYSATTADIRDSFDEGRSMVNYSGHGYPGGWSGAVSGQGYASADVFANTNAEMYPFVISNACQTSMIGETECYAEVWQKAPNGGAIAHWGASNNSYWDEDDVLQRDLHNRIDPTGDTPSLGVIVNLTKLDLYNHYGAISNVAYYYDMYTLLTDPSLIMWTQVPRVPDVSYDAAHPIGEATFTVSVGYHGSPVEGALVAVRKVDEGVFESGYTDAAGEVTLTLDPAPESVGLMDVTVTGHDWQPHEGGTNVISPDTPWLIYRDHVADDSAGGDGDGHANPGEDLVVSVTVENVGEQPGTGLAATMTTSTPQWCQVLDGSATFPDLAPHAQGGSLPDHYEVRLLPDAPDGVMLGLDLGWSADGGASGTTSFKEQVQSVHLAFDHLAIDDTIIGNGNGVAGPGETIDMVLTIASTGHRDATGISGTISSASPYVTILQDTADYPDLPAGTDGDSEPPAYRFEVAAGAPDQEAVTFDLTLTESGSGYGEVLQFDVMISSCATQDSTDVPQAIGDNSTVESTLTYSNAIGINDVNVFVDIRHTYQGDFRVTLESPAGTQVILHNRSGGSSDNIVTWYDTETAPAESLDLLMGENSFGTWKLIVEDEATGDTGTLEGWSLEICGDGFEPTPHLVFDGWSMDDTGTCDPDGVADVGETAVYNVTVRNDGWSMASGVSATLIAEGYAAAMNGPVAIPDLAVGESAVAQVEMLIGAVGCKEIVSFDVEMVCSEGSWFDSFTDRVEWDELSSLDGEYVEHGGAEPSGWSHIAGVGFDDWAAANDNNHTTDGSWAWKTLITSSMRDSWLISPDYSLVGTPDMDAWLEFWQARYMGGTDGGLLEISDDGGSNWVDAGPYITAYGYNGTFTNTNHDMNGRSVWTGNSTWTRTVVDLNSFRGGTVRFKWRVGSGFLGTGTGWWIDDVEVRTYDEPCDSHACGIPGEVKLTAMSKAGGEVHLEWWENPLCIDHRIWRSSDPGSAGGFVDVTGEDPDSTDCLFNDSSGGSVIYWIIEGIGPDGDGPWGHYER
jgi:subtilisin-like proprotein convertase family protein